MTTLAIPSMPPPPAASADGAPAAADTDHRFGDALRHSQAQPEAAAESRPRDPGAGAAPHEDARGDHSRAAPRADDNDTDKDAPASPIPIAGAPAVPVPVRQDAAATGQSVPRAAPPAAPAGILPAVAQATPVPPALPPPGTKVAHAATAAMRAATTPSAGITGDDPHAAAGDSDGKAGSSSATGPATPMAPDAQAVAALAMNASAANAPASSGRDDSRMLANLDPHALAAQVGQLAAAHAGMAATQPPPAPVQLAMQSAPGQPQFAQEAAQHVSWLAGQNIQQAEIQLNPRKLGPIQVEITTHHDRVDVSFAVQHPQTVHALQQTLPQLHDMLAQQGLSLGHASVGHQSPGRQQPAFAQHGGFAGPGARDAGGGQTEVPPAWRSLRTAVPGRVDDFA